MPAFDKFLLIGCICVVIALVLYFFYWNRLIAFLLGLLFRFLYWNQGPFSIWLEIGSIHFSILTGRILFKDFRYHSSNQTIKIVKGQIEWRYWIRRPASGDDIAPARAMDDPKQIRSPACRVQISLQGFEWFLYNRTASYDAIITQMGATLPSRPASRNTGRQSSQRSTVPGLCAFCSTDSFHSLRSAYSPSMPAASLRLPVAFQKAWQWVRRQLPTLDPKDLLPLGIEVTKGAIICGNPSTPTLLVAEFQKTEGMFGIVQSRSKYDLYKQLLHLSFKRALIRYVENEDFRGAMAATGELLQSPIKAYSKLDRISGYLSYQAFAKLWRHLKLYSITRKSPSNRDHANHSVPSKGKHKSLDEDTPLGADFHTLEYAIERKILEAPILELTYYIDVVGDVPSLPHPVDKEPGDIGNGDIGPEWGIDLVVRGGFIRYGPWADRQRQLQKAFFPPTYQNAEQTPHLKPGDKRVWTAMQVFIELRDDTTLYIPFREASKNWQWDGQTNVQRRPRKRDPASIHVTVGDRSSINYIMPMVAGAAGYESLVEVHLDTVEITSSLNDIKLVSAESCRIRGELPSPLQWNARRTWKIGISLRLPVLYILRDHINMFTDLGKDWAAGPPSDYHRFVPTVYAVELELHHFELNLYVNDHNIIDKPLIRDENALLTVRGVRLKNVTEIPSDMFRPDSTTIPFSIEVPDVTLNLSLPRWNTWALHAPKEGNSLAKVRVFRADGFYRYFSEVREDHVEQFKLTLTVRDIAYKGLGWSIRYFMILQNNYFGSFTTFSTLFEYLEKRKRGLPVGDPVLQQYRKGQSNMLQVEVDVDLQNGLMVIPAGLPGYETAASLQDARIGSCLLLDIPELQVHFRLHDFFMELSLNVGTVTGCIEPDFPERMTYARLKRRPKEIVVIDGIDITANRLFGPLPRTVTYVCIWEISIGPVKAALSARDATILSSAGNAFSLNFLDASNAPASEHLLPEYADLTFFKFSLAALDLTWHVPRAALLLSLPSGLKADFNDLGGQYHRKLTSLRIPCIHVKFLLRSLTEHHRWLEVSQLETDVYLDVYDSPSGWQQKAQKQAEFIREQDLPSGRAERMFAGMGKNGPTSSNGSFAARLAHQNGVFLPQPSLSNRRRYRSTDGLSNAVRSAERQAEKPAPWLKLSHLSESDSGEDILDVDRDARLAKTRSETPLPQNRNAKDEEQTLSEGDESDTEDLSGETSSDDNWSDLGKILAPPTELDGNTPALKHYSRLCSQYVALHLDFPSMWEGSPFYLFKVYSPRRLPSFDSKFEAPDCALPALSNLDVEPGDDTNTTVYRFACRKGLEITITPLVVSAIASLEADIEDNIITPELRIDSMLAGHLGSFEQPVKIAQTTVFDIRLSSAHVHILHEVKLAENDNSRSGDKRTTRLSTPKDIAHLHCLLEDVHVIGTSKPRDLSLDARFSQLNVALNPTAAGRSFDPRNHTIFNLAVNTFVLSVLNHNPEAVFGGIALQLSHQSPEYMTVAGIALLKTIRQLSAVKQKWERWSSTLASDVVHSILHASHGKPIIDPLSTIQPSYLVQSGTPQNLRTDTVFRFLFHLRNCLWETGDNISSAVSTSGIQALIPLLESRLTILDPDVFHESHLSSLHPLFPMLMEPAALQPPSAPYAITSSSLELHRFTIMLRDSSGGVASEFVLTDLVSTVRLWTSDFIEATPGHQAMGVSQTSLRHHPRQKHQHISLSISTQEIHLTISPRLMPFAQEVLRVRRRYSNDLGPVSTPVSTQIGRRDVAPRTFEVVANLRRIRMHAAAESLVFEFGLSALQVTSNFLVRPHPSALQSMSLSVVFKELFLRARSPADASVRTLQDILASITFSACKINSLMRHESAMNPQIRLVFSLGNFHFNVPRSALRLYRFAQEWRADFLPGIEATVQELLSELHKAPSKPLSPAPSRSTRRNPTFKLHGQVESFGISLQVMHGTWLSWRVNNIIAYLNSSDTPKKIFGLQLASQIFSITSRSNTEDVTSSTKLKVEFPSLSLCGDHEGSHIQTIALVDFLEFKVKPVHWDTLLAVQQKFGQDFNDLVMLVQETRSSAPTRKPPPNESRWTYAGFLKMRGFRIGLEGLSSTFYLECFDISGSINNVLRQVWSLKLTDLALSLAPKATIERRDSAFNRQLRSAFVIIDFDIKGGEGGNEQTANNNLHIAVTKIHAVMQASSIGEVGDFIDHLQAELWDRKEQRAIELAAFKEKAQSILKTFEVAVQDVPVKEQSSWLKSYVINLSVHNIGVAFPLTHDENLEIPQTGTRDSTAVRAFLFSIKSIHFGTQRGESGEAKMQGLSFQFVSRFRQSVASDFAGDTHQTRNRLLYPEMTAHLRSVVLASSRNIWMRANVSGFILDIDSTIPDYIFSLIDVYEQGRDRVSRLSASIPRNAQNPPTGPESGQQYTALPTSNVFASLTFLSGKVRVYNKAASALSRESTLSHVFNQPSDEKMLDMGADVFNLPMVSVWAEYRATAAARKVGNGSDAEPSILVFKSTVHSSQNTLRPTTLLPFLTELVNHVEARMRQASRSTGPVAEPPDTSVSLPIPAETTPDSVSSMQISFSLRIDQSKLEFTCQPDVNVIAGLHWDSGGFVLHVSPGARKVTLTGSIGGLNVGLKHGFLSEECAKLDMRNLAFSVTFAKTDYGTRSINSVSFVLDTEILGAVRFSRLQDILCFKAVWLDRIPVFNHASAEVKAPIKTAAHSTSHVSPSQEFTTILLIRVRQISLEVDLGQSISAITLDLKDAVARTKLTEALSEVSLYVSDVAIVARGNVSGHASVSNCVFQTVRRMKNSTVVGRNRMLELRMTSDALIAVLESDHQKLLHYRSEPLEVEIFDDWSMISPDVQVEGRTLQLSVTVESPEIVAVVTVGTIPKLLSYANKFKANLEAQREGASRESRTFHLSRTPNPDNPLSAVAEAMLLSAKSRFKEADSGLSYVVKQHMSLRLGTLRLIVFPRTMGDLEIAQFVGRDVCAQLDRLVELQAAPAKRDLQLSFSFMTISRFTQLGHLAPPTILSDAREWLTSLLKDAAEANIVGLPSMQIHMVSEETLDALSNKVLKYDFDSQFNRQQAVQNFEDIYISLNVSLYSWLTLLRKNLAREMDQVRATAEWRTSIASPVTGYRKKGLETSPLPPIDAAKATRSPVKSATFGHPPDKSLPTTEQDSDTLTSAGPLVESGGLIYHPQKRNIERLTMRQLGEATPDVMHPFFMKKAGFNLEDSLPQYVNEYATCNLEEIMEVLLKLYSRQLLAGNRE
ncbi:hypothetical protein B0H17DRAFT_922585 [Mycena rosella]|uniref:Csf1 N-terminal domain-containing protein n=1 Tax=Mycena rosella TaxID=1033263 RepID=A0AAD7E0A7_MYCRO|nr:hypothetical protein B0H17DRAFT_922585 [Mycena rosella]